MTRTLISGDSQFYICLADRPKLDGKYTVFGQVVSGMEIIDKMEPGDGPMGFITDKAKQPRIGLGSCQRVVGQPHRAAIGLVLSALVISAGRHWQRRAFRQEAARIGPGRGGRFGRNWRLACRRSARPSRAGGRQTSWHRYRRLSGPAGHAGGFLPVRPYRCPGQPEPSVAEGDDARGRDGESQPVARLCSGGGKAKPLPTHIMAVTKVSRRHGRMLRLRRGAWRNTLKTRIRPLRGAERS